MDNVEYRLVKHSGQVFTPDFLVKSILDYATYTDGNILSKHVIDNSCGDGAFLCEIVNRYCVTYLTKYGSIDGLRSELETFIHGIELDPVAYENCIYNLSNVASTYGLTGLKWDVSNESALPVTRFNGKMDYVIGNPPYVRVHNLEDDYDEVKSFMFAQDGMTDLYLVFYELGLRMLNKSGKLCYITPSSWLSSVAATNMRNYVMASRFLVGLIDLGHFQAFENATTYTMIALFDKCHKVNNIDYYTYSEISHDKEYVDSFTYEAMCINNCFYVAKRKDLEMLRAIKTTPTHRFAQVKNGFATLNDKVFILEVDFQPLTIPILKASTGKWHRGFYPYDKNGKPMKKEDILAYPDVAKHLGKNKERLLKGVPENKKPDWYLYGRTQALKDVYANKYSINTIIKDVSSVKLIDVPVGSGLYSGLYILTDVPRSIIEAAVMSEDFVNYLAMLKNYKSGGYYTYSSKDLEQYLNYKIARNERASNFVPVNEPNLFEGYF